MITRKFSATVKLVCITAAVIVCAQLNGFSQTLGRINGGVELAIPLGNFSNFATPGGGISVKYEDDIPATRNLTWTAGIGILGFRGKESYNGRNISFGLVPVQGGLKYYFNQRYAGWYGSAELGLSVFSVHYHDNDFNNRYYNSTTYVSFAPGAGYQYGPWDFSGRFQLLSNTSYLSLRAAYVFDLNKL